MKSIESKTRAEIEKYLSHDMASLLCTLSLIESSKKEGLKYLPGQELEQGRRIFRALEKRLFQKVCKEWQFCLRRHDPEIADTVNLVAAIMDVVVTLHLGFPAVLISTILVKKGLTAFCGCDENSAPSATQQKGLADTK